MFKIKSSRKHTLLLCGVFLVAAVVAARLFLVRSVRPNIIFITLDALRADHLGCYGYKRNTSPNIDALSKKGALFTQAVSQSNWTAPSISSIITSLYPNHETGPTVGRPLSPENNNLIRTLKKNGYETLLFGNSKRMLNIMFSYIKSDFDSFDVRGELANAIVDGAILRLNGGFKKPFFLWVYLYDTHEPRRVGPHYFSEFLKDGLFPHKNIPIAPKDPNRTESYLLGVIPRSVAQDDITDTSYYIAKYDGGIKFADEQVGRLLKALRDKGMDKNTLIALFADHGESMTEHDLYFNHLHYLYESLVRVPLIMVYPEKIPAKVIRKQTAMINVMPSVLELAGIRSGEKMEGESLYPLIRGKERRLTEYVFSESSWLPYPRGIRSENWKLIYNRSGKTYELYDLKADPGETHNLINARPQVAALLKNRLDRWGKEAQTCSFLPETDLEERKRQFKALGYAQ